MNNPTKQTYSSLMSAYDLFNKELFHSGLPSCLITIQRHKGAYGYFSGERFAKTTNPEEFADEIALNPVHFATRTPIEVLSTLAHEMVHLWQHHTGKPPRKGYHNKAWATKMREIGLIPTDTGEVGGKETGQKMTHVINENGRFAEVATKLLHAHPAILYHDRSSESDSTRKKKAASKTKYSCPECGLNAWAKPEAPLVCGDCKAEMEAEKV
jgi:predicted SprT family Zn-dependent metalloprotease